MEIFKKTVFWVGLFAGWILWGIATDPTVKAERRKRKQEKLAMDFHTDLERRARHDELINITSPFISVSREPPRPSSAVDRTNFMWAQGSSLDLSGQ